jgi:hypothetical protein
MYVRFDAIFSLTRLIAKLGSENPQNAIYRVSTQDSLMTFRSITYRSDSRHHESAAILGPARSASAFDY